MSGDTLPTTTHGWPTLAPDNYITALPAYTERLAEKLDRGTAPIAEAENLVHQAEQLVIAANAAASAASTAAALAQQLNQETDAMINDYLIPQPWQNVPLTAGVTGLIHITRVGKIAHIRGEITTWTNDNICTIPADFRPTGNQPLAAAIFHRGGVYPVLWQPMVAPTGLITLTRRAMLAAGGSPSADSIASAVTLAGSWIIG